MGTMVTNGNGIGIFILTGARSVMGRVAKASSSVGNEPTLIQREITRFVFIIVGLTIYLALVILLTWVGWLRVQHPTFKSVVAMLNDVMGCVVASFLREFLCTDDCCSSYESRQHSPEGLSTVETLGCVNVICSDKTGTLTENQMINSKALSRHI